MNIRLAFFSILFVFLPSRSIGQAFSVEHQNFQKEFFGESTLAITSQLQIFYDEAGKRSLEEVLQQNFQPNPTKIEPRRDDVYWIHLSLQGHTQKDSTYLFRIGKGILSCRYAEIYLPNQKKPQITGSSIPVQQKPLQAYANYFTIPLRQQEQMDVYIRLAGFYPYHRDKTKQLVIYHSDKKLEQNFVPSHSIYWNGILFGTVLIPIFYFLMLFFIQRERIHLYYVLMVSSSLLVFLFNLPNIYIFPLFPTNPDLSRTIWWIGIYFTIFGLLRFSIAYLELPKRWKTGIDLINKWLVFKAILVLLEIPYISYYLPDFLLSIIQFLQRLTTFLSFLIPVILGFVARRRRSKLATYFLIATVVFIIGSTFHTLAPFTNWYQVGDHPLIVSYVLYISFLLMLILLAIGTGHKMNLLKRKKVQADQLKKLDALKTKLYNNIAHEFRTPLTIIKGISREIKGQENETILIEKNADNLLRLINEMLDLSKLESGKTTLKVIQANLIEHLRLITHSFHALAHSKNINLTFSALEREIIMDFDPDKIQQILSNLLSNALKFTPEYGSISVYTQKKKQEVTILIQDDGIGMSEDDLPHIFDRFRQAANSDHPGTGIGLSMVKELVNLMGGTISVQSELGFGSTFLVKLPIQKEGILEDIITPKIEGSVKGEGEAVSDIEKPTLLIIEDTADIITYLQKILQQDYQILTASDGDAGIDIAIEQVPDIILSDVMMPKKDGLAVVKYLKKDVRTSHIPIILLTAKGQQSDKLDGLEVGADAYLVKPFDKEELFIRLRKLIEIRQQLQQKYQNLPSFDLLETKTEKDDPEVQFLQRLEQIVLENIPDENFKVNPYLCRAMMMSRPQLYRKMKALLDASPSEYIRSVRMKEAQKLVLYTDQKIGNIADAVGYKDHTHFTKVYVSVFGKTPSEARK